MKNRDNLVDVLKKLITAQIDLCRDVFSTAIVNTGKMTWTELNSIISKPDRLDNASDIVLFWMYDALAGYKSLNLWSTSKFFTELEIKEANAFARKKNSGSLPVRLPILAKLTDSDNYLTVLSVQQIAEIKNSGLIQWKEGMQREAVLTKISDNEFVTHIKYDDNRARAIGESMVNGTFFPNALRWHIVSNECEYEISDKEIILKSGYFAEIDGQHRDKGSEYALIDNPEIIMQMPIVLTIGSRATAQHIINQDEERAPINKDVVAQYKNTTGNNIVKKIIGSGTLDSVYKFCDTDQGIKFGQGFILKSEFAKDIDKYYTARSSREQDKVSEWIIEFMNSLAEIKYDDFNQFRSKKTIVTAPAMITYYVYLSSMLKEDPEWENKLAANIAKIDFADKSLTKKKPEDIYKGVNAGV